MQFSTIGGGSTLSAALTRCWCATDVGAQANGQSCTPARACRRWRRGRLAERGQRLAKAGGSPPDQTLQSTHVDSRAALGLATAQGSKVGVTSSPAPPVDLTRLFLVGPCQCTDGQPAVPQVPCRPAGAEMADGASSRSSIYNLSRSGTFRTDCTPKRLGHLAGSAHVAVAPARLLLLPAPRPPCCAAGCALQFLAAICQGPWCRAAHCSGQPPGCGRCCHWVPPAAAAATAALPCPRLA